MRTLFTDISTALSEIQHGWTTEEQALMMAACIVALRPTVSVEIGVWAGKGLVTLALAHKAIGHGMAIGIDPYSKFESVKGQVDPLDQKWWGQVDHVAIFHLMQASLKRYGVTEYVRIAQCNSDAFPVPDDIGLLRVDGNHGEQALRDVERFAPKVVRGGYVFLDDLNWKGDAVETARGWLIKNGFKLVHTLNVGSSTDRPTAMLRKL